MDRSYEGGSKSKLNVAKNVLQVLCDVSSVFSFVVFALVCVHGKVMKIS